MNGNDSTAPTPPPAPEQNTPSNSKQHFQFEPTSDPYMGSEVDVFLAFEGGGAKGIAHVAALYEIEAATNEESRTAYPYKYWPRYKIRGASGTSIGALIAMLVSIGFTARQIIDVKSVDALVDSRKGIRYVPYAIKKTLIRAINLIIWAIN